MKRKRNAVKAYSSNDIHIHRILSNSRDVLLVAEHEWLLTDSDRWWVKWTSGAGWSGWWLVCVFGATMAPSCGKSEDGGETVISVESCQCKLIMKEWHFCLLGSEHWECESPTLSALFILLLLLDFLFLSTRELHFWELSHTPKLTTVCVRNKCGERLHILKVAHMGLKK